MTLRCPHHDEVALNNIIDLVRDILAAQKKISDDQDMIFYQ
jgi:hypothetical protein